MSRSRKKNSFSGNTNAKSEKEDKKDYNRRFRHTFKQSLHINPFADIFPHLKEYSNPWCMGKDGKRWFDSKKYPKEMRK